jgi:hypothetical protein
MLLLKQYELHTMQIKLIALLITYLQLNLKKSFLHACQSKSAGKVHLFVHRGLTPNFKSFFRKVAYYVPPYVHKFDLIDRITKTTTFSL